ncbi:MAG: alanine--tRNA ligase, partial [Candidatus Bathyarchaeia archaeon]
DGIIPPPANPLVISQPCLRFEDIDKVGPTAGRHLTIFEMGGHHAFNYPEESVYWKDETVRLHHGFATEELGVKSELVTYKEGLWSGGGNAGRDYETLISGLEVSTLVFMMYKVIGDEFVETPIKTVDTGYGMERWCWLSQGSPSGFHAVYGDVLNQILEISDVAVDEGILRESARYSALMGTSDPLTGRERIGEFMGMDPRTLEKRLGKIERAYAIADYTKALVFMLAEGVVPSNVREGYLVRLLTRRALRYLIELGIEDRLPDIIEAQIRYWSRDFPHLTEMSDEMARMLEIETKKYFTSLRRGKKLVKRLVRRKRRLTDDELIELYDSHGLLPELVSGIAKEEGAEVRVPQDFYAKVAQRHQQAPRLKEEPLIKEIKEKVADLPETHALYYDDAYLQEFRAKVLRVIRDKYVVLDQTAFYPEGGGQPGDVGLMTFDNTSAKVINSQKVGNVVVHEVRGKVPKVGQKIVGRVGWQRRASLMRFHTATHILLGAARRVLGQHVWQAGAQKGEKVSRLDISHYSHLTQDEIEEIERLANSVVLSNISVEVAMKPRQEAEANYGFRLYQGGVVPGKDVRVVKIGDWDVEACGGTHCRLTGEVGLIKVVRSTRIQDGVERLIFKAGMPALELVQTDTRTLSEIARALNVPVEGVGTAVSTLVNKLDEGKHELKHLMREKVKYQAKALLASGISHKGTRIVTFLGTKESVDELIELAREIVRQDGGSVAALFKSNESSQAVVIAGENALREGIRADALARRIGMVLGGKGGGDPDFAQAGGTKVTKVPEAMRAFKAMIKERMRR